MSATANMRTKPPQAVDELLHRRAAADDPLKLELARGPRIVRQQRLAPLDAGGDRRERIAQAIGVQRPGETGERTVPQRIGRHFGLHPPGHEDDVARRIDVTNRAEHVEPRRRALQIDEHRVRPERARLEECVWCAAADDVKSEVARGPFDCVERGRIVADGQKGDAPWSGDRLAGLLPQRGHRELTAKRAATTCTTVYV